MADINDQFIGENYAIYNGDCVDVIKKIPNDSTHLWLYSPPFCGLFHYSSSERDMSNCRSYQEFFVQYGYLVQECYRTLLPGRIAAVHCMDVPSNGANLGGNTTDFPGDIIRLHQANGFDFCCRYFVWKEPLGVRNRTMAKGLTHRQVVEDSSLCDNAAADQLLMFRKRGDNKIPIQHPTGLTSYAGSREIPHDLMRYKNWKGKQTENRYSHWIWRQYASAFWDDVRIDRVLPYREARDAEDEKHIHPLQLDVIERAVVLWTNPGEVVVTPFLGVGSEAYGAVINGRKAIGAELKPSYYRQAVKNLAAASEAMESRERLLFPVDRDADLAEAVGMD